MRVVCKKLRPLVALVASISALSGVDRDKGRFNPTPIEKVDTKQTADGVTVAVVAYNSESEAHAAFGKVNPYEFGILPVLLMISNESKETLKLEGMTVEYIDKGRDKIEATPASEVKYARSPKRPSMTPSPIPGIRLGGKKNPLAAEEIEMRGWTAKMLPPGESAHGFIYFQTGHRSGSHVYITGIRQAATGHELFYFDIPLD